MTKTYYSNEFEFQMYLCILYNYRPISEQSEMEGDDDDNPQDGDALESCDDMDDINNTEVAV